MKSVIYSNRNSAFNKFLKSLAFYQLFSTYIQNKGAVGLFQHLVDLIDSDVAVFGCLTNGEQHFTVDRQDHCLLVLIHHRQNFSFLLVFHVMPTAAGRLLVFLCFLSSAEDNIKKSPNPFGCDFQCIQIGLGFLL